MLRGSSLSSSLKYPTLNRYWKKFLVSAMISGVSRSNVCPTFSYLSTNDLTAAKKMDFLICDMLSKICFLGGSTTLFLALSLLFPLSIVRFEVLLANGSFLTSFNLFLRVSDRFGNFSLRYDIA